MEKKSGANVLGIGARMGQKSRQVLDQIGLFLSEEGIHSSVYKPLRGICSLEVIRFDDVQKFLAKIDPVVKREQVQAALAYLEGRISGDELISQYDFEFRSGRRKKSPKGRDELRFPMTRAEALKFSSEKSRKARSDAIHEAYLSRLGGRVLVLPSTFDVSDIQRAFQLSRGRAQSLTKLMEREGLVSLEYRRVPPRFHKVVCTSLI